MINFFPKILEKVESELNGEITIYRSFGLPKMSIGGLLQSGGIVGDIWRKASSKIPISNSSDQRPRILILGLGCGTAAKIFAKNYPKAKIVGVEIDPVIINLGKKYFELAKIPNLKIVCQDAGKFSSKLRFDLIIIDLYLGETIPGKLQDIEFLKKVKKLLAKNGFAVFNRIFWDRHKLEASQFVDVANKVFSKIELVRVVANLLVICG